MPKTSDTNDWIELAFNKYRYHDTSNNREECLKDFRKAIESHQPQSISPDALRALREKYENLNYGLFGVSSLRAEILNDIDQLLPPTQ